jgi:outer membrane beta-barrel protein
VRAGGGAVIGAVPIVLAAWLGGGQDCAALVEGPAEAATTSTTASPRRRGRRGQTAPTPAGPPPGVCVDKTLQEELLAKRRYRLTKDRLFVKALRHELALLGGYYASDLFDGTFTLGGAYTFFPSENFGTELSVSWSRLRTSTADTVEEANNFDLPLVRNDIIRTFGTLQWSPLYGKVRLFAGSIWRYDFYLLLGPGVVVDPVSFGIAANVGVGLRVFLHRAVALRFEVRDYMYGQELLSEKYFVNDIAFQGGVTLFLPTRN